MRLRPDGAKGLLVSQFESFAKYQQQRAWTWELQALIRARYVAGDSRLCLAFDQLRSSILARPRIDNVLRAEVVEMRHRMRTELDRSGNDLFDIKHGSGGLTDIEFFLQAQVLMHAEDHPDLLALRETPELIEGLTSEGILRLGDSKSLLAAVEWLQAQGLSCHLNNRKRLVPESTELAAIRDSVIAVLKNHDMVF